MSATTTTTPLPGAFRGPVPAGANGAVRAAAGLGLRSEPSAAAAVVAGGATGRVVAAIADAVMPTTAKLPKPAGPVAAKAMESFLAELPRSIRLGLVGGIWALELSAVLFHGRRLSRLPVKKRQVHLGRIHHAKLGALPMALRGILTPIKASYFADEEVAAQVGYRPPPPERREPVPLPGKVVDGRRVANRLRLETEVVVIGSGAGGAVVAKELAERGRRVVLLEEGLYHERSRFNRRPLEMSRMMYRDSGITLAFGSTGIPIPLGRTVGGTTTINSGTCFRIPEWTLAKWRADKGLPFTPEDLAPAYEKVEAAIRVQPVPEKVLGRTGEIISRGARAMGMHPHPLLRNAHSCEGSGVCCFGCPVDAKQSMNVTYVPRALEAGATLLMGARATRLQFDGRRPVAVAAKLASGEEALIGTQAVVVSCGTIYTPLVLKAAGLGRESGQLGRNLSIHPATKCAALMPEPVYPWSGVPQGLWIEDLRKEGIVFEGVSMPPDYGAIGFPFFGERFMRVMERYSHVSTFGFLVEDSSQGRVDPGLEGRPFVRYELSDLELSRIRKGIDTLSRIYFAGGAQLVFPPVHGLEELRSEADLAQLPAKLRAAELELTAFHPLGTCRMGVDPGRSVIDPDLETWEADRVWVVDGSIFPSSLGVNPQLTIMAFATRTADAIDRRLAGRGRWGRS